MRQKEVRHQATSEARQRQLWNSLFGQQRGEQDEEEDPELETKVRSL